VLAFQNKKLAERIEQRKRAEEELRKRIEQLEFRQRTDDAVLMIVNRYSWLTVGLTQLFQTQMFQYITMSHSYSTTEPHKLGLGAQLGQ
jgi:hypothetical protein